MAFYLGSFNYASTVLENPFSGLSALNSPTCIAATEVDGQVFVYVGSDADDFVTRITVTDAGGTPVMTASAAPPGRPDIAPEDLMVTQSGDTRFLILADSHNDRIRVSSIGTGTAAGQLTFVDSIVSESLAGVTQLDAIERAGKSTIIVAVSPGTNTGDTLSTYRLSATGRIVQADSISDDDTVLLNNVSDVVTLGTNRVVTISEEGVALWNVGPNGSLTLQDQTDAPPENANAGIALWNGVGGPVIYSGAISETGAVAWRVEAGQLVQVTLDVQDMSATAPGPYSNLDIFELGGVRFLSATNGTRALLFGIDPDDGSLQLLQEMNIFANGTFLNGSVRTIFDWQGNGLYFGGGFNPGTGEFGVSAATIGAADDNLVGTDENDVMVLLGGQDTGRGGAGQDTVKGGDGGDSLLGEGGTDWLHGDNGDDVLKGGSGSDNLTGGTGADTVNGGTGSDWSIYEDSGVGVAVNLALSGPQSGGDAAGDVLVSIENVQGSNQGDTLRGTDADNRFLGMGGGDQMFGGLGNDLLVGGGGNDFAQGDDGDDRLFGEGGEDTVEGGNGNDTLSEGDGFGACYGGAGNDTLSSGTGGGALLSGGIGNDRFELQADTDVLAGGGAGADVFDLWLDLRDARQTVVTISDFGTGRDRIDLTGWTEFADLAAVKAAMVDTAEGNVEFTLGTGAVLVLLNVSEDSLTSAQFLFG